MPVLEHEREPWRQRQRAEMRCQQRNDAGLQGLPDERDRDACPCGREQSAEKHHRDTASTIPVFRCAAIRGAMRQIRIPGNDPEKSEAVNLGGNLFACGQSATMKLEIRAGRAIPRVLDQSW